MPNKKSLENLIPAQPGEVRNPNGRPKGSKNLSTIIRELENEEFDWTHVPLKQKDAVTKIGSPWRVITYRALAMAANGDIKAMKWLKDAGYGSKLTVEAEEGFFSTPKIQIEIIQPNHDIDINAAAEPDASERTGGTADSEDQA